MAATTTAMLRPGDTIGGFRVDDVIGMGGMAIVYRAEQLSLGRPVALKILSRHLTDDDTFRERFRREGVHAAALEHPHIVPVYDSGEQDGHLYLAMRLVEGTNLADLIRVGGLSADRTIEVLKPIAGALDTAHAAGLIHRDVKPQNILIANDGHPYLADFGVAKGSNTLGLTATGGFLGSVNYASPEQIKGLTLTPASDIYALTAVLFHCLTGDVPYHRDTDAGIMHAHLSEPPPALPAAASASSELHTVLARGMAKDPGSRYGHAGDLINAAALAVGRMPSSRRKAVPAFPHGRDGQADAAGPAPSSAQDGARAKPLVELTTADERRAPPPPAPPPARTWWRAAASGRPVQAAAGAVAAMLIAAAVVLASAPGHKTPTRPQPSATTLLAQRLARALAPDAAVREHQSGLRSAALGTRAAAARRIAHADSAAAGALGSLRWPGDGRQAALELSSALRKEASSLGSLAKSASNRDSRGYAKYAAASAAASRSLLSALSGLRSTGLGGLPRLAALHPAALPKSRRRVRRYSAPAAPAQAPAPPAQTLAATPAPAPSPTAPVRSAPAPSAPVHHTEPSKTIVSAPK